MNPPLNIETLRAHWANDWLEPLGAQIFRMQHDKELRDEFLEMIQAAPDTGGGIFAGHYNDLYVASQVMAVRRLDDDDGRTLSLRRLIGQVFQHRNLFTRDWYVARWAKEDDDELMADWRRRAAEDVFDRFVDEPGAARIGGRRLQEDQEELRRLTSAITEFATTWVAHHQAARDGAIPTYDQFEVAVAHVAEVFDRYHLLITFASLLSTKPAIQPDWKAPFRGPLAEPGSDDPNGTT